MHHLFCGLDPEPLSHHPFESHDDGLQVMRAGELGWRMSPDAPVRFLPCLGGFVGSEALVGILATGMHESESLVALVDLGTNGEVVVGTKERMLCASTAAGPAFEGGAVSAGMQATTGDISEVGIESGRLVCRVLGDVPPRGLCGSGLVDAAAAALDLGLIEPSGRLANGRTPLALAGTVSLDQSDIRELQLAKGAVAAALRILLARLGAERGDLDAVHLSGAFGNYVNHVGARRIGLLGAAVRRVEAAGNTALLGAKLALFRGTGEEDDIREMGDRVEHVSLATDPEFQTVFVDELGFPA